MVIETQYTWVVVDDYWKTVIEYSKDIFEYDGFKFISGRI